jgi:mannose-6-phosphate isomerase-like protein (cupin superfamily)
MAKGWQLLKHNDVPPQHFGNNPKTVDVRFYRDQLGMSGGGMTVMKIGPGITTPAHIHKNQEEVYMPIAGKVAIRLKDEVIELQPFDAVRVSKAVSRALRNIGEGQATIIAFGTPNTGPGDAINIKSFWD